MPFCEHCGEEIGYLPFNCNYCGGTFCKQHRLPENHECTFELKHKPVVPTTSRKSRQRYQDVERPMSQDYLLKGPRQLKKYLKRQEKQRREARRVSQRSYQAPRRLSEVGSGIRTLIILMFIFTLIEVFRPSVEIELAAPSIYDYGLIAGYLWRIFTAPFVYNTYGALGLFFFFIMIYFLYYIGKIIELQYGKKFLYKFYFLCIAFQMLFYALLELPFALLYPDDIYAVILIPAGSALAPVLGFMALSILPLLNREITGIMTFFPVRMKGKTFLWILILFSVIPAVLFFLVTLNPYYFVIYLPDLGGILAAYLIVNNKIRI